MYSIGIADDEKKICTLIENLIDWEGLRLRLTGAYHDGESALAGIREHRPDIFIADIRMPVHDGLDLIRIANEEGIAPTFIVVSGYRYFEYVYSAMKFGVADYLLKPIEQKQLNDTLRKTCRILDRQRQLHSVRSQIELLSSDRRAYLHARLLAELADGSLDPALTADRLNIQYDAGMLADCFQALFIRSNREALNRPGTLFGSKLCESIGRMFPETEYTAIAGQVPRGILCILNFHRQDAVKTRSRIGSLLRDMAALSQQHGNARVTIGISGPVGPAAAELQGAVAAAIEAERAKVVLGDNRVIALEEARFSPSTPENLLTEPRLRAFVTDWEAMRFEKLADRLADLNRSLPSDPPPAPLLLFQLRDAILNRFESAALGQGHTEAAEVAAQLRQDTDCCGSREDFFAVLADRINQYGEELRQKLLNRERLPIRLAKSYIEENFHTPLTLEEVASKVGLSASYFSTSFKKHEGQSFVEYLTGIRIEAAKTLLRATNDTTAAVAAAVGYPDDKYFLKVFKKNTGIRPNEYRRLNSR